MAAPSGTQWGSIYGSGSAQGRIGVYITNSSTQTQTTVTMQVWFWTKYSVYDSSNTFHYSFSDTGIITIGSVNISHPVSSGGGWSTSNQTHVGTYSHTYTRGTSARSISCAADYSGIEAAPGSGWVSVNYTIPARNRYSITYNANGGSGAPSTQYYYYGNNTTLSSSKPTRTGYTFLGWSQSSTASTASYQPGQTWSETNANNYTLYAVWKINTWTVKYDANGGSGAPASQTKTYGQTLKITTSKPTRTDYNFIGWGTSPDSTTVAYEAGGSYINDADITLYAIWEIAYIKPRIANLNIDRCDADGTLADDGTHFKISFDWATDEPIVSVQVEWTDKINGTTESRMYMYDSTSGENPTSGSISEIVADVDIEHAYDIKITIEDEKGESIFYELLPTGYFVLDFKNGGSGLAIGEAATDDGFSVNMESRFKKEVTFEEMMNAAEGSFNGPFSTPWIKTNSNGRPVFINHVGMNNELWLQLATAGNTAFTNFARMNADNQVEINWTSGGLKGRVMKELWTGTLTKGGSITVSEIPYYNFVALKVSDYDTVMLMCRGLHAGSKFVGGCPYPVTASNGNDATYNYSALITVSGTKLTLNKAHVWVTYYQDPDYVSNFKNLTVTGLYGLL